MRIPILIACLGTVLLTSCGGAGAGGSPASSTTPATTLAREWYDPPTNSELKAEGPVLSGTAVKHGAWTIFHPQGQGGGVQWTQTWVDGAWDRQQPWTEVNADGSLRDTWLDR